MSYVHPGRVMTIDPATHSYAYCVAEYEKVIAWGKVEFDKKDNFSNKFVRIDLTLPKLIKKHKPDKIVIEQTIMIQNPQTTRLLSYVVGYLWGKCIEAGVNPDFVSDVIPVVWKAGIGYKNVSAKEKQKWRDELGTKEANKKANFERKERVKRIVDVVVPDHGCTDYDIIDAIGIALWATTNVL